MGNLRNTMLSDKLPFYRLGGGFDGAAVHGDTSDCDDGDVCGGCNIVIEVVECYADRRKW